MKKVLIAGESSYIGKAILERLQRENIEVRCISVRGGDWKQEDFSLYDVVVNVAAIVHKKDEKNWESYKCINVDLAYELATKAKNSGVGQYIFLSSMAVYGLERLVGEKVIIDETTPEKPNSLYGKSKLQAEKKIAQLRDDKFRVVILRPPNVYGKKCPGNYMEVFMKISTMFPFFPKAYNEIKQGYISIINLSELVWLLILNEADGMFFPQDERTLSTCELVECISQGLGKRMLMSQFLGRVVRLFGRLRIVNKVYGGLAYSESLIGCEYGNYQIVSAEEAIWQMVKEE